MNSGYDNFIKLAIKKLPENGDDFSALKKELSGQLKLKMPTNADLRGRYEEMIKERKIKRNLSFEKVLISRKIRTASGVAIVAVLTKAYPCPGKCIYCPTEKNMPKSYLSDEPAVMRAIHSKFNPYHQVQSRLQALELNGHHTDKIELIVMGGTFSCLPKDYQKKFIAECFRACNDYPRFSPFGKGGLKGDLKNNLGFSNPSQPPFSKGRGLLVKTLSKEQRRNERTRHRIIGLTLETRPDYIDAREIINFRELGCTRVELGVQSIFNDVLQKNKRGHNVKRTIQATKLLKDAGFKINYHIMPGLPGSNLKRDYLMFK
jgi:elongator complex protein 3